jgi:hypothetical protein
MIETLTPFASEANKVAGGQDVCRPASGDREGTDLIQIGFFVVSDAGLIT